MEIEWNEEVNGMALTAREKEQLLLAIAADLAKHRLKRGKALNYAQSAAFITMEVRENARSGASLDELRETCGKLLSREQVMPGIPEMLAELRIEVPFAEGIRTITFCNPISRA